MRCCLILFFLVATKADSYSQIRFSAPVSKADSISIEVFWKSFRSSVQHKDKQKLASLFKFPFYCHQCIDYVQANDEYDATVIVSKKIFLDSVYKLFFDIPTLNKRTARIWTDTILFHKPNDNQTKGGWIFSYAIIAPSKEYEGIQGFIYIRKQNGRYIIDGLDTVP